MRIPAALSVAIAATLGAGDLASQQQVLGCAVPESPAGPLDSLTATVGASPVKICYVRVPSTGGVANWGRLRETDLPVILTSVTLRIGEIEVGPGRYALVPVSEGEMAVVWVPDPAYEGQIGTTAEREVGRIYASGEELRPPVDVMRVRSQEGGGNALLFLEWGNVQLMIPILAARSGR